MKTIKSKLFLISILLITTGVNATELSIRKTILTIEQEMLYLNLELENKITRNVFQKSINKHKESNANSDIISIIDFSQPSNVKRLAVIDLKNEKVIFNEYVSHGKKSGWLKADKFSNINGSNKSSLGQYKTGDTYYGKHGYSLILHGKDETNSKAKERNVVFHGASYASEDFVKKYGYLGRSLGCPAVDKKISGDIINVIKNGTYIYAYN